jgi:hypothetical protein
LDGAAAYGFHVIPGARFTALMKFAGPPGM